MEVKPKKENLNTSNLSAPKKSKPSDSPTWNKQSNAEEQLKEDKDKQRSLRSIFTIQSVIKKTIYHSKEERTVHKETKKKMHDKNI